MRLLYNYFFLISNACRLQEVCGLTKLKESISLDFEFVKMHWFPSFADTIVSDAVIWLINTTIILLLYYYFTHNT